MRMFELRDPGGRLIAQCDSHAKCEREASWHGLVAFHVVATERDAKCGRPHKYVAPWPPAKRLKFAERYLAGDSWKDLEGHFSSSESVLSQRVRRMGLVKRRSPSNDWIEPSKYQGRAIELYRD